MRTFSPFRPQREKFIVGNYRERKFLEKEIDKNHDFTSEWGGYFYFFDEFLAFMKKNDVRNEKDFDDAIIDYLEEFEGYYIGDGEIVFHPMFQTFLLSVETIVGSMFKYLDSVYAFEDIHEISINPAPRGAVLIIERKYR